MSWIKNITTILCSILISLLIFEAGLRVNGRYLSQASQSVEGTNTIWTRSPNSQEAGFHPDLGKKIAILFDQYGSRVTALPTKTEPYIVAIFGDSFTENRRIENRFSFVEILNDFFDGTSFLNFGVDGFGLEQSYAHYLEKKDKLKIDEVIYTLYSNDLRNTYEVNLFDQSKMSDGYAELLTDNIKVPWYIQIASKIHITYLAIEGYYKWISAIEIQKEKFSERLGYKFNKGRKEFEKRFHDEYADTILNRVLSGNPNASDQLIIDHFIATLTKWRSDVEASGGKFHIVVVPTKNSIKLVSALEISNYVKLDSNEAFSELSGKSWRFENDGHWNEFGNLSAALSIRNQLGFAQSSVFTQNDIKNYINDHIRAIDDYYAIGDSKQN